MTESIASSLILALLLLVPLVNGCSFFPVNPHGPWIGGFSYGWSNPLITTDGGDILVSNLVVYDTTSNNDNTQIYETNIIINASSGEVTQKTAADNYTLTPVATTTNDIAAGYGLNVTVATNGQTAVAQLQSPNGTAILDFAFQAPDDNGLQLEQVYYRLLVSLQLNTAYLLYSNRRVDEVSHYAVVDLSQADSNGIIAQLEVLPIFYARWDSPDQYDELQLLSLWDGSSCYGRVHLHYNETHIVVAEGMGYYTYTQAIQRGETVRDHSYFSLIQSTAEIEVPPPTPAPSLDTINVGALWYWQPQELMVTNYTLRESNMVTGEIVRETALNMQDIQDIANDLISAAGGDTTMTTTTTTTRQFLRTESNNDKAKSNKAATTTTTVDLSTIRVQTVLQFEFFKGKGTQPEYKDIGDLVAATSEFFRRAFRTTKEEETSSFVDWTMTNVVVPGSSSSSTANNPPDQFTLEFTSNIVQEGQVMTSKGAADVMGHADFKEYIRDFARASPTSPFHSTFKVHFKGITKS